MLPAQITPPEASLPQRHAVEDDVVASREVLDPCWHRVRVRVSIGIRVSAPWSMRLSPLRRCWIPFLVLAVLTVRLFERGRPGAINTCFCSRMARKAHHCLRY